MTAAITNHLKRRILSGFFVVLPLFITAVILKFLVGIITDMLSPVLLWIFLNIPVWIKTHVSLAILIAAIYLLGLTTGHLAGRWLVNRIDQMLLSIPFLNAIYGSSRDVVRIFLNPERQAAFKEVVLVEFPAPGLGAFGFITGQIINPEGQSCYKVFIPTTPNPTTGFLEVIEQSRVIRCPMTVEEGIKIIMSGGILGSETLQPKINSMERKQET
ncbi:MAG TPA: DUF502 domain-containing protein [Anaerohalosphaeraceae bacterium]|nr:DUF502 domain-containing protein [Phycisphaerae bacterium]HOK96510.1 DUF502 domain-containing protein [Anaerohalosphaeraceae bacterium]HOL31951.1 DUF502 domain-containing protein [Anaerohalosphaeraceae bacterium]HOM76124.1 DUF502 domain-containing protein [Anaerohalosphaeraceae bacterium]HPC63744.1 DUF502 domain-containing protein [Anaerohalosphaeraceae bacterium]